MQHTTTEIWTYRRGVDPGVSSDQVVGYGVEARDGSIGKVDESTIDAGTACMVVDTGPWIFGKKVMLPAGVIRDVNHDQQKVFVDRTKDEIKNAPEYDDSLGGDERYRSDLGSYYGPGGMGYRDLDDR